MTAIKVPTSFNIDLEFEIPEFHRRLLAWLIDLILQIIYYKIAFEIYTRSLSYDDIFTDNGSYNRIGIEWMLLLPLFLYHPTCEILFNGQSAGKKIMGIRVVNENGGRPALNQFIIRWLIRAGDWTMIIIIALNVYIFIDKELRIMLLASVILLIVDIVLVVGSKKSQRLGDILAHTILVNTRTRGSVEETVFMEVADNYIPVFPQIMKLSDRDINAIKSILDTSRRKGDFNLAAMASEKIKGHLKIDTQMSPFDFLDTLMKDYNYLSVK